MNFSIEEVKSSAPKHAERCRKLVEFLIQCGVEGDEDLDFFKTQNRTNDILDAFNEGSLPHVKAFSNLDERYGKEMEERCPEMMDYEEPEMIAIPNIPTSNSFQILDSIPTANEKPKPILYNSSDEAITTKIAETLPDVSIKPYFKFKKVFPMTKDDEDKVLAIIAENKSGHFRHNNRRPKVLKVALKGLPCDFHADVIKDSLTASGFSVIKVSQFRRPKTRAPIPIFMLLIARTGSFKDIFQLTQLQDVPISVEPYRKKAHVPQCYKCQNWGHLAHQCSMETRCRFCGLNHDSRQCPRTLETPLNCANCAGAHPSSSATCPARPRFHRPSTSAPSRPPPSSPKPPDKTEEELLTILGTLRLLKDAIVECFGDPKTFQGRVAARGGKTNKAEKMAAIFELLL